MRAMTSEHLNTKCVFRTLRLSCECIISVRYSDRREGFFQLEHNSFTHNPFLEDLLIENVR